MTLEDRGLSALSPVPTSKLGPLDRVFRAATRSTLMAGVFGVSVLQMLRGARAGATLQVLGTGAAVMTGAKLGLLSVDQGTPDSVSGLERVHLSLNVGEAVLFPAAGGLVLLSSGSPKLQRDGAMLLGISAVAGLFSAAVAGTPKA